MSAAIKLWHLNKKHMKYPNYKKARDILAYHGYMLLSGVNGPTKVAGRDRSMLEFFNGPKGTVILQLWEVSGDIQIFTDWGVPMGLDEFAHSLME